MNMKKVLFRIPFATAVFVTIIYALAFGLKNVPQSSIILACFTGTKGKIINFPNLLYLPFSVSSLWNIVLVSTLSFIAVYLFFATRKSETVKKAIAKLFDISFLTSTLLAVTHFISTDFLGGNYWGPIYGSSMVFFFSSIVAIFCFRKRRKIGVLNLLSFNLFLSLSIGVVLSFFSGVPTGLFTTLISLAGTVAVYFLGTLFLWIIGEDVFTSLDWLRKEDSPKKEGGQKRPRFYISKKGRYLLKEEEKVTEFKIFWISSNTELINQSIADFNKEKKINIQGVFIPTVSQSEESFLIFYGQGRDKESTLFLEENVCTLAAYVAEKIDQKNVKVIFGSIFKELELEK